MLAAHLVARLAKHPKLVSFVKRRVSTPSSTQPKGTKTGLLLTILLVYLIASRIGPVVFSARNSALSDSFIRNCQDCISEDYRILIRQTFRLLRAITRTPGVLTNSRHSNSSLMGCKESKTEDYKKPEDKNEEDQSPSSPAHPSQDQKDDVVIQPVENVSTATESQQSNGVKADDNRDTVKVASSIPSHVLDSHGHVKKKGSLDTNEAVSKRLKELDRNMSTQSVPALSTFSPVTESPVCKFKDIEATLKTGDLALLYRHGQSEPHFAVFVNNSECDEDFPLLFIKGKTRPIEMNQFKKSMREVRVITAVTRIFYGDYERVAIRRLTTAKQEPSCSNVLKFAEEVESIPYTNQEIMFISDAETPVQRSRFICTFILAHLYHKLGMLLSKPEDITPSNFQDALHLEKPFDIKLPPTKPGPLLTGEPPLLAQIAKGMRPSPQREATPYTEIRESLQTGDLVLFSGATSSGAIIKIFDGAIFSHVGVILRPSYSTHVMVWESSTNKAGLVDVDTGAVRKGVELLPLRNKIFSGWYDHVAIRRLTGISEEKRDHIYKTLLQVRKKLQGVPYEKSHLQLILSAIDVDENYLTFLKNREEDLSSIFCSELVAHAYQEMGLLGTEKKSNEFTPDDFSTHKNTLNLLEGTLGPEEYIELNFDYEKEMFRQTSIPASKANQLIKHTDESH